MLKYFRRDYLVYCFHKLYFIFIYYRIHHYGWQRGSQFVRLMTNTSVLPSILIGLISIGIAIKNPFEGNIDNNYLFDLNFYQNLFLSETGLALLIATTLIFVLGGRYFFKRQTSGLYSEYSIEGRAFSDAFCYISYTIWKECVYVRSHKNMFNMFVKLSKNEGKLDEIYELKKTSRIRRRKKKIKRMMQSSFHRQNRIQWIDAMILTLAKEMRIPARRLSDYLFHFSPDIFTHELRKTLYAMYELLSIAEHADKGNDLTKERRIELANNISNFYEKVNQRKRFQTSLIINRDLHSTLIGLCASGFGLSNAFESYCLGIQDISREFNKKKSFSIRRDIRLTKKLIFFYHKRKLFAGFDLHALLLNYAYQKKSLYMDEETCGKLENITNLKESDVSRKNYLNIPHIALPDVKNDIDSYLFKQRTILSEKLFLFVQRRVMEKKDEKSKGNKKLIFVTQGYSGVVNRCLHNFSKKIADLLSEATDYDESVKKEFQRLDIYLYILLSPEEIDDFHRTSSRYVLYKFKDNPDVTEMSNQKIKVKLGDLNWLSSRFNETTCIKILLSGAEFIQVSRRFEYKKINADQKSEETKEELRSRLINNEGVYSFLEKDQYSRNIEKSVLKNYDHLILAEDFKLFKHKLDISFFRKSFNSENLEYTNLYQWKNRRFVLLPSLSVDKKDGKFEPIPTIDFMQEKDEEEKDQIKKYFLNYTESVN